MSENVWGWEGELMGNLFWEVSVNNSISSFLDGTYTFIHFQGQCDILSQSPLMWRYQHSFNQEYDA